MITENEQQHNNPYQRQLYDRLHLQDFKQIETGSSSLNNITITIISDIYLIYIKLSQDRSSFH